MARPEPFFCHPIRIRQLTGEGTKFLQKRGVFAQFLTGRPKIFKAGGLLVFFRQRGQQCPCAPPKRPTGLASTTKRWGRAEDCLSRPYTSFDHVQGDDEAVVVANERVVFYGTPA